jgi:UDPglucose--hexose-1-phosphate uridylyltransferase
MEFRKFIRNQVEYRFDPLTGDQCRINPDRAKRLKQIVGGLGLTELIDRTKKGCPFCPERVEQKTPKFPKEICQEGRMRLGETLVFPNANPFGEHHAVGVISGAHFLDLDEFRLDMLRDNLMAAKNYILSVHKLDGKAVWPIYVWNYMPPSAGSIIHPHVQVLVESEPLPMQAKLLEKSKEHFSHSGGNYWRELVKREKELNERSIHEGTWLSVIASFAPRGFNELQFIFNNESSLVELEEKQISDFAGCLLSALRGYKKLGIGSFNLITFSCPLNRSLDYYRLNVKLISRPYPGGIYTTDTGPFERLCDAWVIDTLPEIVAENLRPFFPG